MNAAQHKTFFFAHQFSLVFVYLMCGPRQLFFQYGPKTTKGWTFLLEDAMGQIPHFTDEIKETDINCHGLVRSTSRTAVTFSTALFNRLLGIHNLLEPSYSAWLT